MARELSDREAAVHLQRRLWSRLSRDPRMAPHLLGLRSLPLPDAFARLVVIAGTEGADDMLPELDRARAHRLTWADIGRP